MEITKEKAIKLNQELKNTRIKKKNRKSSRETIIDEKRETKRLEEQLIKDKSLAIEKFKDPDILLNIKKELDKDHVSDSKPKMFLFCDCCSSRLRPEYRYSTAITGDTSEGKTNLWKTIKRHLPNEWYLDLTRITGSSMEDDIKEVNLIYFGEGNFDKGANATIIEQVKQLVEDGMDVIKKDARTNFKEKRREQQPRKVGLYSTTRDPNDEELASRYCIISVHGSPSKYKIVNQDTLRTAANVDKEIDRFERDEWYTWIMLGLRELKSFDFIKIPFCELLSVECGSARSQRDLKRFLNLIRVLAWICQYNRLKFIYRGYSILIASPEDFYNAMEIGKEIFDQSLSGLEPRLQKVIESYHKLRKTETPKLFDDEPEELSWIDRSKIQQDLGIKTRDTISKRFKKLCSMNLFIYKNCGSRSYVAMKNLDSPSNLPSNYPLITVDKNKVFTLIKNNYRRILEESFDGISTINYSLLDNYKTNILSLKNDTVDKPSIISTKDSVIALLYSEIAEFDGKNSTVNENDKEIENKPIDQIKDIKRLFDFSKDRLDNDNCFDWNDDINNFIKNDLGKDDPTVWIGKQIELKVMEEPVLGKLRFLVDFRRSI